jgi:hypothetical protein
MNADQSINHPKKKDKKRHNTRRNRHGCNHWLAQLVERERPRSGWEETRTWAHLLIGSRMREGTWLQRTAATSPVDGSSRRQLLSLAVKPGPWRCCRRRWRWQVPPLRPAGTDSSCDWGWTELSRTRSSNFRGVVGVVYKIWMTKRWDPLLNRKVWALI